MLLIFQMSYSLTVNVYWAIRTSTRLICSKILCWNYNWFEKVYASYNWFENVYMSYNCLGLFNWHINVDACYKWFVHVCTTYNWTAWYDIHKLQYDVLVIQLT